jgi:hypothetical protein
MRRLSLRPAVAVATAALGLAACGSTVQQSSQVQGTATGVDGGLGAVTPTTAPTAAPVGTGGTGGGTGWLPGHVLPSATAGSATAGPGAVAGAAAAVPVSGRGWDRTTVSVGIITNSDIQQVATTLGVSSLDSGDQKADAEAMIAALNARGGLFGRKVKGYYYDVHTTDDRENAAQRSCTFFTQDHPVIAVISGAVENDTDNFRACMARAHTMVLAGGAQPFDDKVFSSLQGEYYLLPYPSWNDLAPTLADRLAAQGYFSGWNTTTGAAATTAAKVGVLALDTPILRRVADALSRELTRVGHKPYESYFYSDQASAQAAVLRFRADGITHVISTDQFLFLFMNNADSQGYRPRYGISTPNAPGLLLQGTVPANQLVGAMGVGFMPDLDVDEHNDPRTLPPAQASCLALMAKHGVSYPPEKRFARAYEKLFCDAFTLLAAATVRGGGLGPDQVRLGVAAAGASLRSSFTFASILGNGVYAEPGAVLDLAWGAACGCFRYSGTLHGFRR